MNRRESIETREQGLTLEPHFSVAGYGGPRLPFRGITEYLCGLVSVYERPIIAGVRVLIVYSTIVGVVCRRVRSALRQSRRSNS